MGCNYSIHALIYVMCVCACVLSLTGVQFTSEFLCKKLYKVSEVGEDAAPTCGHEGNMLWFSAKYCIWRDDWSRTTCAPLNRNFAHGNNISSVDERRECSAVNTRVGEEEIPSLPLEDVKPGCGGFISRPATTVDLRPSVSRSLI